MEPSPLHAFLRSQHLISQETVLNSLETAEIHAKPQVFLQIIQRFLYFLKISLIFLHSSQQTAVFSRFSAHSLAFVHKFCENARFSPAIELATADFRAIFQENCGNVFEFSGFARNCPAFSAESAFFEFPAKTQVANLRKYYAAFCKKKLAFSLAS